MRSKRSSLGRKRRDLTPLLILLTLSPYIVGFTSDSTASYVETMAGAGGGQYVYHDCSGAHSQRYTDVGISVTKKFEGPYRMGFIAGGISAGEKGSTLFLFPDLALDWKLVSIGTTGFRLGSRNDFYFEGRWLDQPPLVSGKGLLRAGFGWTFNNGANRFWIGSNVIPYYRSGIAGQLEFPYSERSYIYLNGRLGRESGMNEYGVSLGIRYISF